MEWEGQQRQASRRWEREEGRRDATEDLSEDLSEGEKGDIVGEMLLSETPRKKFQRNFSNLEVWSEDKNEKKLYIVLIRLLIFSRILQLEHAYKCNVTAIFSLIFHLAFNCSNKIFKVAFGSDGEG